MSPDTGLSSANPVGTVVSYNNALLTSPTKIPVGSATSMDANGLMSILTEVSSSSYFYWNYVYQWVPGAKGSCGGACTLASPGKSVGATGGTGSVNITATSTWDVIAVDSWITVTSPTGGTGNSSVAFTVAPNTGGPRTGTLIIGGQQYTIYQDGTGAGIGTGTGGGLGATNIALNKPVTVNSKYPTVSGTASAITSNPFGAAWFAYQGAPSYCSLVVDLGQSVLPRRDRNRPAADLRLSDLRLNRRRQLYADRLLHMAGLCQPPGLHRRQRSIVGALHQV
jgi:hypothetical protein